MKILFITHETTRTGAPMVLLHFLRWLQKNKAEVKVDLITLKGGGLEEDFRKACDAFYDYGKLTIPQKPSFFKKALKKLKLYKTPNPKDKFLSQLKEQHYDLVYANTVVTIPLAYQIVTNSSTKCIAHIHELNDIIKQLLPDLKKYGDRMSHFITPSKLVAQNLINNWGIASANMDVVYECAEVTFDIQKEKEINQKQSFIVGASGYVQIRKGYDLFIQVARQIFATHPDAEMQFIWVGKVPHNLQFTIEEDLKKLKLSDKVTFTDEIENPANVYDSFDVFIMTSREDPFPLVCIEVGMLGKPIICFQGATGTEEMIINGGGKIVSYLDVNTMAKEVMHYYNNPDKVKNDGEFNQQAFSKFTPELICPQYFDVILKTLQK